MSMASYSTLMWAVHLVGMMAFAEVGAVGSMIWVADNKFSAIVGGFAGMAVWTVVCLLIWP